MQRVSAMYPDRKRPSPWERDRTANAYTADDMEYLRNYSSKHPKFDLLYDYANFDIYIMRAALKASPAVVSLVSYSGEKEIFQGSGTIIESDDSSGIILTSAYLILSPTCRNVVADNIKVVVHLSDGKFYEGQILTHDFHYNLVAIKIHSGVPLPKAHLRHLDDSLSISPSVSAEKSFQLLPHSNLFNITPGDRVIALGRYFIKPFDLMAAPGPFSLDRCEDHECKELFRANCRITRCGTGGPIINHLGDVIGIAFYDVCFTPFIPINIAVKWWEHYKKCGELRRPWLGMDLSNLHGTDLAFLEKIIQKFPGVFKGVIVDAVLPGSFAASAGICPNDVIVQCSGKAVQSFLELFDIMWDKVGDPVELLVLRLSHDTPLSLSVVAVEATPDDFYSWDSLTYVI